MKLTVASLVAILVSGCASIPVQKAQTDSLKVCNYAQMARVDRIAQAQRTEVLWVNCPLIDRERANAVS